MKYGVVYSQNMLLAIMTKQICSLHMVKGQNGYGLVAWTQDGQKNNLGTYKSIEETRWVFEHLNLWMFDAFSVSRVKTTDGKYIDTYPYPNEYSALSEESRKFINDLMGYDYFEMPSSEMVEKIISEYKANTVTPFVAKSFKDIYEKEHPDQVVAPIEGIEEFLDETPSELTADRVKKVQLNQYKYEESWSANSSIILDKSPKIVTKNNSSTEDDNRHFRKRRPKKKEKLEQISHVNPDEFDYIDKALDYELKQLGRELDLEE